MTFADQVVAYLSDQRWYAGKDRPSDQTSVGAIHALPWLTEPSPEQPGVRIELVDLHYADGGEATATYQVPMAYARQPLPDHDHALIGERELDDGQTYHAYDAVFVHAATEALLHAFTSRRRDEEQAFTLAESADLAGDLVGSPLTGEQSNTSIAYDDVAILKLFRRLSPGGNPDIEIHDALTRAGNEHVAPLLGWIDATWPTSGGPARGQLGLLQSFLTTATDGWAMAMSSVRDLLIEEDLDAAEVGGDLSGESERLGEAVAAVHAAMAIHFGVETTDPGRIAAGMHARLDAAVKQVGDLAELAPGIRRHFDRLASHPDGLAVQRVHGDLHLGQTLRTVKGWKIIDFEGEPLRSLAERRGLDSPLRDVAGMLRSLDYAAGASLHTFGHESHYEYHAQQWYERNRDAFWRGYVSVAGPRLGARLDGGLLAAYEADKAVYEAVYEAGNRPSWAPIPLRALARIAESAEA